MTSNEPCSKKIRLTAQEQKNICDVILDISHRLGFDCEEISLFGSRANLTAKGGDIDLYIKVKLSTDLDVYTLKRKMRVALKDVLGDQKIDLIIDDSKTDLGAFGDIVSASKVKLWTKTQVKN